MTWEEEITTKTVWSTPGGPVYRLYQEMLEQPHLLVAGATGSGKSVVINGIMATALHDSPARVEFILVDPKRVELAQYKRLPHVIMYASEPADMPAALDRALSITETRYREMQKAGVRRFDGPALYVIIDELADLMTTQKKAVMPRLQRLCQIGRAANVHVIAATQCPLATVIPTAIGVNFDSRVALRTRNAQDSRNIIGVKGCECLPRYGQGFYLTPAGMTRYQLPMVPETELTALCSYWTGRKCRRTSLF